MGLITAVATAVLAVFAIVTAWYARQGFRKQSSEVRDQAEMIRLQAEEFNREAGNGGATRPAASSSGRS